MLNHVESDFLYILFCLKFEENVWNVLPIRDISRFESLYFRNNSSSGNIHNFLGLSWCSDFITDVKASYGWSCFGSCQCSKLGKEPANKYVV